MYGQELSNYDGPETPIEQKVSVNYGLSDGLSGDGGGDAFKDGFPEIITYL